tara:strand:+ start:257 stop:943 length:687 start_codon:yes stop_codon:yes gene_type:complete
MSLTHTHAKQVAELEKKLAELQEDRNAIATEIAREDKRRYDNLSQTLATERAQNLDKKHKHQQHNIKIVKEWITFKIEKEIRQSNVGDEEDIEMDFGNLCVEVTGDFVAASGAGCSQKLRAGEVVPDFVDYLLTCQAEDCDEDEEYYFHVNDEMWQVSEVLLSGKDNIHGKMYRGRDTKNPLKWLFCSVRFSKIEVQECCVSGDTYPVSQMVTNGDDWMYKGIHEAFE